MVSVSDVTPNAGRQLSRCLSVRKARPHFGEFDVPENHLLKSPSESGN